MGSLNRYTYLRVVSLFLIVSALTWTMTTKSAERIDTENLLQICQQDNDHAALVGHRFTLEVFHAQSYFINAGVYVGERESLVPGVSTRGPPPLLINS